MQQSVRVGSLLLLQLLLPALLPLPLLLLLLLYSRVRGLFANQPFKSLFCL